MRKIAAAALVAALSAQASYGATQPPQNVSSTYRISPGDQLEIYVWGDPRLQRELTVLPDGTFAFPLAGTIVAGGRTPNEVEAQLAKLLAPQYKGVDQQVTVSVKAPSGMQISIIGKVKQPGNLAPTRYLDLIGALALAGGPTDFADVGNIVILRHNGNHTQVIKAHVGNILKGKPSQEELGEIPQLVAGDTVIVP